MQFGTIRLKIHTPQDPSTLLLDRLRKTLELVLKNVRYSIALGENVEKRPTGEYINCGLLVQRQIILQEFANYSPRLYVSIDLYWKEPSHPHSLMYCLWQLSYYSGIVR